MEPMYIPKDARLSKAFLFGWSDQPFKEKKPPPPPTQTKSGLSQVLSGPGTTLEWLASDGRKGRLSDTRKVSLLRGPYAGGLSHSPMQPVMAQDANAVQATWKAGTQAGPPGSLVGHAAPTGPYNNQPAGAGADLLLANAWDKLGAQAEGGEAGNTEGWTKAQDDELMKRKTEGETWAQIAEVMRKEKTDLQERFKNIKPADWRPATQVGKKQGKEKNKGGKERQEQNKKDDEKKGGSNNWKKKSSGGSAAGLDIFGGTFGEAWDAPADTSKEEKAKSDKGGNNWNPDAAENAWNGAGDSGGGKDSSWEKKSTSGNAGNDTSWDTNNAWGADINDKNVTNGNNDSWKPDNNATGDGLVPAWENDNSSKKNGGENNESSWTKDNSSKKSDAGGPAWDNDTSSKKNGAGAKDFSWNNDNNQNGNGGWPVGDNDNSSKKSGGGGKDTSWDTKEDKGSSTKSDKNEQASSGDTWNTDWAATAQWGDNKSQKSSSKSNKDDEKSSGEKKHSSSHHRHEKNKDKEKDKKHDRHRSSRDDKHDKHRRRSKDSKHGHGQSRDEKHSKKHSGDKDNSAWPTDTTNKNHGTAAWDNKSRHSDQHKGGSQASSTTGSSTTQTSTNTTASTVSIASVYPDDIFSMNDLLCLSRLLRRDHDQMWFRLSCAFMDRTGRYIHPDILRKKLTGDKTYGVREGVRDV